MGFNLFGRNKELPDLPEEDTTPNFRYFFKLLFRKFSKLISLNLLMLFQILPLVAVFLIYFFAPKTYTQTSYEFASLFGVHNFSNTPTASLLLEMRSEQLGLPVLQLHHIIIIAVLAIFLFVTWGWQNVGATYVLREMVTGKPAFVISDYFYAIKRNRKQAFWVGLFDAAIITVLVIDFIFTYFTSGGFFEDFMFFGVFAVMVIYSLMRMYLYLQIVTFDLSFKKLIKNSLIFAFLGIKRNLLALFGIILLAVINILLIFLLVPFGIAVQIIIPFLYFLAVTAFMSAYAAFPVIKKYMIDPYENESAPEGAE